jgi:acetylornithine deacetylase/succinyl-diaminopimelate desuccinylase-like protein
VPCSFRLLRQLLERVEDSGDGRVLLDACHVEIPAKRIEQAQKAAQVLGGSVSDRFPFVPGAGPDSVDGAELILNRTWRPALSVIGMDGVPRPADAGNVLRPFTSAKLSMRLPPTADPARAAAALKETLEKDPPNGAGVTFQSDWNASGWHAPDMTPWLEQAVSEASERHFGRPAMHMGEGGTIPFMGMLGEKFPEAQFLITGLLGPGSNAHGPNEFIHLPTAKRLTCCVAEIIAAHADTTPQTRSAA